MSEKTITRASRVKRRSRGGNVWLDPARFSVQCRGKDRYPSKRSAAGAARALRQRNGGQLGTLHAYRCPVCRHWHVGSGGPPRKEG